MKKVAILLCIVLTGVWGNSVATAEPVPNKFGVAGLYTLLGNDTSTRNTVSLGFISDISSFNLPKDPRTPRLQEFGFHIGLSLGERAEIAGLVPYRTLNVSEEDNLDQFDEGGMGDILMTAKIRMLDEWDILPALGMYSMVSFPTGDEEKGLGSGTVDLTVGGILTKRFDLTTLYGNVGFLLSGWDEGDPNPLFDNYQNSLLYGIGAEFPLIGEHTHLFSELTFVHEFGSDKDNEIMTFRGLQAQDEPPAPTGDAEAEDPVEIDTHELTEEDAIAYPSVLVVEDVVNDAGQASIGMNIRLGNAISLSGGASVQILGEDPVPDAPKWRAFVNLSYLFGLRGVAMPVDVQPFPVVETQPGPVDEGKAAPAIDVRVSPGDEMKPLAASGDQLQNQCPVISDILLSDSLINGGEQVRITIKANDPDNDPLSYLWIVPRGQIAGTGSAVVWTAPQCSEIDNTSGVYDVSIEVSDGLCSLKEHITLSILCDSEGSLISETTIFFQSGSTKVDNIAKAQLDQVALLLKQFPNETIILEGHADNTGTEPQNIQVGLQRAENIKRYLVSRHGIDPNRMTLLSHGSMRPAASNATADGRAQNRRVEIFRRF